MKNSKLILPLLFIVFLFYSCEKEQKNIEVSKTTSTTESSNIEKDYSSKEMPSSVDSKLDKLQYEGKNTQAPKTVTNITDEKIPETRMIIKSGNINIEIDAYSDSEQKVLDIVKKYGGSVASSNVTQNAAGKKQGNISVRVPSDKYDYLLKDVATIGKVLAQNIKSSDVTEEYIDLDARVKTQKDLEQRITTLLQESARNLSDIITLEDKLASIRKNIESIEGRMRFLKNQSDFSTLTINLYEPASIVTSSGSGFFDEIWDSIKSGLKGFTKILGGIFMFLIAFTPVIVFGLIIFWIVRKIIRKRTKNAS